ncbi:MAG: glycosyltransferase family 2 protein [Candidatus Eremiobacteraeota bacterium]|nr:glycosyltransferase family 2 protein [Candidatus Eremiobacteraeota bacterium]
MQQHVPQVVDSMLRVVRTEFDGRYYRETYRDVALSGIDPVYHYVNYGWKEGRRPRADFDPTTYLQCNQDVASAGVEPFYHYLKHGRREARAPYGKVMAAVPHAPAPTVSILVPAFRPDFLDICISSALGQSYGDFELLISDDSIGDSVQSVVSKWQDERIRYINNPNRQQPGANRDCLIENARGRYLKFLFDDDFLLPKSVSTLVTLADELEADLAFHSRYEVDKNGKILEATIPFGFDKSRLFEKHEFAERVVSVSGNIIGEPSNILIAGESLRRLDRPFMLHERRMRFLTDVALYCNFFAADMKIALIGYLGSAFRRHSSQNSQAKGAIYSAGIFEWEFILRWAADRGWVDEASYLRAMARLLVELYRPNYVDFPELNGFIALAGRGSNGKYLTAEFLEVLDSAHAVVDSRVGHSSPMRAID